MSGCLSFSTEPAPCWSNANHKAQLLSLLPWGRLARRLGELWKQLGRAIKEMGNNLSRETGVLNLSRPEFGNLAFPPSSHRSLLAETVFWHRKCEHVNISAPTGGNEEPASLAESSSSPLAKNLDCYQRERRFFCLWFFSEKCFSLGWRK